MCYQEKRAIISIISSILITTLYGLYVYQRYLNGELTSENIFSFWGSVLLILIPVLMVFKIIIHIIFNIINKIATNEDEPKITDEFDKLIMLKAIRNTHIVFMIGFILSMASLVINVPHSVMFISLIGTMIVSCIVGDISQLYFYKRGV